MTSSQTLNAAIAVASPPPSSDGIVQVSTGGAEYLSGPTIKDMVTGSVALAAYAYEVAKKYDVNIALHTDHCPKNKLDGFVRPLLAISAERVKAGRWAAAVPERTCGTAPRSRSSENLEIATELLALTKAANIVLEVEIGVVGGEEDGVANEINEQALHDRRGRPGHRRAALGLGENGRYMAALTFGNVHGVYKPGNVKLRPEILKEIQDAVGAKYGKDKPFDLVFHGGSGSLPEEISAAVDYGVIKMNVDTDTQYAFSRPVVDHMLEELRRPAQDRRRGRQQEGVRPAGLGQVGRGRPGRPGRRGLREPAFGRYPDQVIR